MPLQDPLVHFTDDFAWVVVRSVFLFFFFFCCGSSSPKLSIDEFCCHFFGKDSGGGAVSIVKSGDGRSDDKSNGSGVGMSPFLGFRHVKISGGMFLGGGVDRGLSVLGFGDAGAECKGSVGVDMRWSSSSFLNSKHFSNFSQPGLKDLTHELANCLGGVLYLTIRGTIDFGLEGYNAFAAYE